jgi:hypothetical protein
MFAISCVTAVQGVGLKNIKLFKQMRHSTFAYNYVVEHAGSFTRTFHEYHHIFWKSHPTQEEESQLQ